MNKPAADDSWSVALAASKKVGYIPTAFPQAIRLLVGDYLTNEGELRAVSKYQVARVFRADSFKVLLYFAARSLAPDLFKPNQGLAVGDLIAAFGPLDLAAIISASLVSRRTKKVVGEEVWSKVAPHYRRESELGAIIGVSIPSVGFAPGLLIAALRNISHALLIAEDPKSYDRYRAGLKTPARVTDSALELSIWKTTSTQVMSLLLAALGFRAEIGQVLTEAIETTKMAAAITEPRLRAFRLAVIWSDCYIAGLTQPREKLDAKFFPFETDSKRAEVDIARIRALQRGWIDRDKSELTKELAPHLFVAPVDGPEFEIPEQLKDVFSLKELTSMEEEDFDNLVDQIDAEQAAATKKRDDVISSKDLQELEKSLD
jgi:hypothetical protein